MKGVRIVHRKTGAEIEGLTPSQASGDASSDSGSEELESELQRAFALEEDEDVEILPNVEEGESKAHAEIAEAKSIFEEGSSSWIPFTSKNQRMNYLRRVRKKIAKARKIIEVKTLGQVETKADDELPIPTFSPLLKGSGFHPLAVDAGEERVTKIASSMLCSVDYSNKKI
ncbi:hypothetical protein IEQ34_007609 [Dendrobium chrysotoxum]|uniref:Uncharacterized protein n=1 Tax=Dendrobium chrysotoxum TaxID=161865 RepID=A0AAV7H3Y8_DENCH|nr:hypothetical protein IEQ34_007609 [Dendrobium chrysotoxum]